MERNTQFERDLNINSIFEMLYSIQTIDLVPTQTWTTGKKVLVKSKPKVLTINMHHIELAVKELYNCDVIDLDVENLTDAISCRIINKAVQMKKNELNGSD